MDYGTRAKENFLNGYNCCQAVFLACTDELGLDTETRAKIASSFGGGMGGGASVDAMAFLVINNGNVRLIPMEGGSSPVDKLIDLVPEVVDKVNGFFAERRERKAQKKAEENECADEIINQGE